jgi:hypothetical protein
MNLLTETYSPAEIGSVTATNRKVAGSVPSEVIDFSVDLRTVSLGPSQPPIELSTRNIHGGKVVTGAWDNLTAMFESIV